MVNSDETHFLAIGTEISAKYKGAFCEAKITKIILKSLKCQVQFPSGISKSLTDQEVKGKLKVGATVDIKCKDKKELVKAKIQKIQDCSQYTVEFGDGDVACLKRTALYMKNEKYSASSATLNHLPFYHPEHSGRTALAQGHRGQKRKISVRESGEEEATVKDKCVGKVVCVETTFKKNAGNNWFPGLIVVPTLQSPGKTNILENHLVRSFKDGKYYTVPKKEIREFSKDIGFRVENHSLKTAVEKAIFYLDNDELPPHWDRDLLFGVDKLCIATDSEAYDGNNSDRKSMEEKDHFVAQLFKFMDDRRTPINQAPVINKKDVDLHKLFKVVYDYGGFKKVNRNQQWMFVSIKAGFKHQLFASVKDCYQKYLLSFEDFYRKLGCTMLSYPRGISSRCRFSRSIISNKNSRTKKEMQEILKKEMDTLDNDQIGVKKEEKKKTKTTNNLSRKSAQKHTKQEKVLEVKTAGTSMKKLVPIKEETKTFLKVPAKKSKRGTSNTQKDNLNKGIFDGVPKLTKSKTKEDLSGKSRRVFSNVVQMKVDPFDKGVSINVGDNVSVFNRNKENSKAKVLKVNNIKGVMKYYIHYVGYNQRHDRWIDAIDIDYKINELKLETEGNNDVDSSKVSPRKNTEKKKTVRKKKNNKQKKVTLSNPSLMKIKAEPFDKDESFYENLSVFRILSTTGRTRDSSTSPIIYSEQTESCYSSTQPRKTCTLINHPKFDFDGSNKKVSDSKAMKLEPDIDIKIEPLPKSCVFEEMQNNTSEEVEICAQLEVFEQNESMIPFVPNSNSMYSFDNVELNVNENLIFKNEMKDPISHSQYENESNKSQNVMISGLIVNTSNIKEIRQHSQDNTCHEVNVSDIKDEVLDLCMKPLESPPYNIFSTPEPNYVNEMIVEEDDDDDDETKLMIVENDYQIDAFLVNHKSQNKVFMNNIDENTKFGFKFDLNSKLSTLQNRKNIESATKLFCEFPVYEPTNNNTSRKYEHEVENIEDKYANKKTTELPELQFREEIEDNDTVNNASVKEYNLKSEYDIFGSKSFVDLMHQPGTSKDSFYKTNTISDAKNSLFVARQAVKSVIFDTEVPGNSSLIDHNISSISKSNFYENPIPSTSKSFYENSIPSTSKSFYYPKTNVNSVLFCENIIPSSPTSTVEPYDEVKSNKVLIEEREAALAMYTMNQSFCRPMTTLMHPSTEKEMKEYTNIFQNEGTIPNQRNSNYLAKISGRNVDININDPLVTEPIGVESEPIVETNHLEKIMVMDEPIPMTNGEPLIKISPRMNYADEQTAILKKMKEQRKKYAKVIRKQKKSEEKRKKKGNSIS